MQICWSAYFSSVVCVCLAFHPVAKIVCIVVVNFEFESNLCIADFMQTSTDFHANISSIRKTRETLMGFIWRHLALVESVNMNNNIRQSIFHSCIRIAVFKYIFFLLSSFLFTANSSPKIFGPSYKRIEGLSIVEQNELKGAAWFQAGIPREISLEVLGRQSPGAFLVRQSSTKPGCFALSLRVPPPAPKVAHYLILRTSRGYKIKVWKNAKNYFSIQMD